MVMSSQLELEVSSVSPSTASYQHVVVQQSVTMLAYMDKTPRNISKVTDQNNSMPRIILGFSIRDLPILIGAAAGAVGLTIIILIAVIVWHCCRSSSSRDKAYSVEAAERGTTKQMQPTIVHSQIPTAGDNPESFSPNDMVICKGGKPAQIYETQVMGNQPSTPQIKRSTSLPFNDADKNMARSKSIKSRPTSQPFSIVSDKQNGDCILPSIPESLSRGRRVAVPQISQCASYSALDEPNNVRYIHAPDSDITWKTRSLPSWGKQRPLSTEDDLNELYAKVSFSKKRKNRMGNDSAAAIAMNKSTANYTIAPFAHKDTDALVENEAVVVYDERTSL